MVNHYLPERGDIVWLSFDPTLGREQAKRRPALIISPQLYNAKASLILSCPITSKIKNYPFEVAIHSKRIEGVVLVDHLRSLDWSKREIKFIEKCTREVMIEVQEFLSLLIFEN